MSLAQRDSGEETMSKTVTKADIAKSICAQSEMKQQHAKKVLDAMLGIMKKALKEEKEMLLSGFGKFEAFTKKNRKGRNPQTGEEITIEASKLPAFKAGKALKDSVQ
jgi:nucleoid DNA-binding protein